MMVRIGESRNIDARIDGKPVYGMGVDLATILAVMGNDF